MKYLSDMNDYKDTIIVNIGKRTTLLIYVRKKRTEEMYVNLSRQSCTKNIFFLRRRGIEEQKEKKACTCSLDWTQKNFILLKRKLVCEFIGDDGTYCRE